MTNQKLENLLNLSLQISVQEREQSTVLGEGFSAKENEWELIVKYAESLGEAATLANRISYLLNEFAIVWIEESNIEAFAAFPQIEYIEMPKRLFFALDQAAAVSCVPPVRRPPFSLFGQGVLVAVLDSGLDIFNEDFQDADGTTRVVALWDQTWETVENNVYELGRIFSAAELNDWIDRARLGQLLAGEEVPGEDRSGHGTAVTGIAAGNGANSNRLYQGIAPQSQLLIVKLGTPDPQGFPRTTQLMQGVDFVVRTAREVGSPLVINLSFGNTYGAHDGDSLLETFLDASANNWKTVIVTGTGNEGAVNGHLRLDFRQGGQQSQRARFSVGGRQPGFNLQLWKSYVDIYEIQLVAPGGEGFSLPLSGGSEGSAIRTTLEGNTVLIYIGEPSPYSTNQELFFDFIPKEDYVTSGVWELVLQPVRTDVGEVNLWLPSGGVLSTYTGFLNPTPRGTLTIPSTAKKVISVGAYDSRRNIFADFSGQGIEGGQKPDLVAPGVGITAPNTANGYAGFTGTSMAAPMVSGAAALLIEWGIVKGNDPYLYGEKAKAYLRSGARKLPGFEQWPNVLTGYGALCVEESLPK